MKHLKVAFLALLLVTSFSNVNAQDSDNPWAIGFGANAVDFYPTNSPGMLSAQGFDTGWFDEVTNAGDHWNIVPAISRLTVGRYISDGFSFEVDGSFNKIKQIGDTEVNDLSFWGVDGIVKWSANSVFDMGWFDPYLLVGGGYTWLDTFDTASLNAGFGMNFWFNEKIGLNLEGRLRQTFESDIDSHFQYNLGVVFKMGGKDTDGDGVYDKHDACPEVFGLAEFNGCPDTDGDGIIDGDDACPNTAGLAEFNGCPDTDGDGIIDKDDACPTEKGTKANKGCPDTDGDGVVDKDDACPKVAGPAANKGCPWPDADGDGVFDKDDECPKIFGEAANKGCPMAISDEVMNTLKELARTVYFSTSESNFKKETYGRLDLVVSILKEYPTSKFHIEGHTDSTGPKAFNQKLSDSRANAVRDYLISKGIKAENLTAKGYGESQPVDSNSTSTGRAINRRVEIKLVK